MGTTETKVISKISACLIDYITLTQRDYIVFHSPHKSNEIQATHVNFMENNYLHLTGVEYSGSATRFFQDLRDAKIRAQDIRVKANGSTEQKMEILPIVVRLPKLARVIADHDGCGVQLQTDVIIADNKVCCVGFIYDARKVLIPNTALNVNYRKCTRQPVHHILLTMSKPKNEERYTDIEYLSKNVDAEQIICRYSHCIKDDVLKRSMNRAQAPEI